MAKPSSDTAAQVDEDIDILMAASQEALSAAQAFLQFAQAAVLTGKNIQDMDAESSDSLVKFRRNRDRLTKPGRGNSVLGARAAYVRGASRRVYDNILHSHHPALFHDHTHFGPPMFDHLITIVKDDVGKAFDLNLREADDGSNAKKPRKRLLGVEEMFFAFLAIMGGGNEGGVGLRQVSHAHGVCPATMSRYMSHTCMRSWAALKRDSNRLRWMTAAERAELHGLVPGFPKAIGFVDGTKFGRWRPEDEVEQARVYDGRKHTHCFAILVWNCPLGTYIRVDVTDLGAAHDRRLYDQSPPYMAPSEHFSEGEHLVADTGFIGDGEECVCPFKKGMGLDFALRGKFNRSIRATRMLNEWGVGFISNRHRIFLGRWPFDPDLFTPAFEVCALMANELFAFRGYALQTRERYAEKRVEFQDRM